MTRRVLLSKEEVMQELEDVTTAYASLLKKAELSPSTQVWRAESTDALKELEQRVKALHASILRLPEVLDRAEANTHATVLLNAIGSVLNGPK